MTDCDICGEEDVLWSHFCLCPHLVAQMTVLEWLTERKGEDPHQNTPREAVPEQLDPRHLPDQSYP